MNCLLLHVWASVSLYPLYLAANFLRNSRWSNWKWYKYFEDTELMLEKPRHSISFTPHLLHFCEQTADDFPQLPRRHKMVAKHQKRYLPKNIYMCRLAGSPYFIYTPRTETNASTKGERQTKLESKQIFDACTAPENVCCIRLGLDCYSQLKTIP